MDLRIRKANHVEILHFNWPIRQAKKKKTCIHSAYIHTSAVAMQSNEKVESGQSRGKVRVMDED